jgi:hypothetical protein
VKNAELAEASRSAEALLREISESTAVAAVEAAKVATIVEGVTRKAQEIAVVKEEAERDLAEAKPALDAALAALNSITPKASQPRSSPCLRSLSAALLREGKRARVWRATGLRARAQRCCWCLQSVLLAVAVLAQAMACNLR